MHHKFYSIIVLCSGIFDALEFAKIDIFEIGIHHTSLLGIWFACTLSVIPLIFVKATRPPLLCLFTVLVCPILIPAISAGCGLS